MGRGYALRHAALCPVPSALALALLALPSALPAPQRPAAAAQPPAPQPQHSALGVAAPWPPAPRLGKRGTVSHRWGTRRRGSTFNTPLTEMLGWHPTSKISPISFLFPGEIPVENIPRAFFSQKFFKPKIRLGGQGPDQDFGEGVPLGKFGRRMAFFQIGFCRKPEITDFRHIFCDAYPRGSLGIRPHRLEFCRNFRLRPAQAMQPPDFAFPAPSKPR